MMKTPEARPNVLLLETIATPADEVLRAHSQVIFAETPATGENHINNLPIHAIVTRGKGQVNRSLIDACKGLQIIARCGVGLDNVDVDHASSRGVRVVNAPGSNSATVAEHALSLMLMLQRKMALAANKVKAGNWGYRATYDGDDLRGKRLGILGFGNIGQRVAKLASAFGMDVQFWDARTLDSNFEQVSLEEIIEHAHVISIHLPLLESTKGLLSLEALSHAKHNPIIINTARGGLIKDADVLQALKKGIISGFGADVLEIGTPPAGYELLQLDEVIVTPHSASLTQTTYAEMCLITVQNTLDLLSHKPIDERYIFNRADVILN
ncbi:MAG: 2-hydroxyacid dehydrogenase [Rhodothermales bacterium]